jgi:acetyltransferase-like isoleucine patch superfamily enzyme
MRRSGLHPVGRLATWMGERLAPKYKQAWSIAMSNPLGYISTKAVIEHPDLRFGKNVFIDERVVFNRMKDGGPVVLKNRVTILRDGIVETGDRGGVYIGEGTYIHPYCQLIAYKSDIVIGSRVMLAPNCAFYPHDHGIKAGIDIIDQPIVSKGPIRVGDNVWLGTGVIVLGGVTIGNGSVIGAGSVVTKNIPENAIAIGNPAKIIRYRPE